MAGIEYRHVIVPVDGSENAGRAARFAANLAYCCEASLTLVHVFPEGVGDASALPPEEDEKLREQTARQVFSEARKAILGGTRKALDAVGSPVREELLRGDPAEAILEYARQQPDAMIVIGSRGLSRLQGLLLGSVSEQVIRRAECPVTVVR